MDLQFIIATILSLALVGCAQGPSPSNTPSQPAYEPSFEPFSDELASEANAKAEDSLASAVDSCLVTWFDAYTSGRVQAVEPTRAGGSSFGPWEARPEMGTTDAAADGSLTEWAPSYYIAHDWSAIGTEILALVPEDLAQVNGQSVVVEGIFNYPKDAYYEEVMQIVGDDAVVFQTCYPDSDLNRIVYGHVHDA